MIRLIFNKYKATGHLIRLKKFSVTVTDLFKKIWHSGYKKPLTALCVIISLLILFVLADHIFPFRIDIPYSSILTDSKGTTINACLSNDDKWRMYTGLEEITPAIKKAIVYKEDRFFYYHFGINPFSVARAIVKNIVRGKRTSGASTITMQVARLLEPKERTYGNKIIEMFRALQLEWHFSKDEILQLYLNLVPYGGNIEGVKAASLIYFNKMPDHLSIGEIAVLSIIPNNPNMLRPGKDNSLLHQERNKWLNRYKKAKLFAEQDIEDAKEEALKSSRHEIPRYAPHIAQRLFNQYPEKPVIHSTINFETQLKVESIVKEHINRWYFRNVKNAAVLVIDNKTGNVIAYAGSADFYNEEDGGQVDGIRAIRSPGSTLKPLIYGLAIDHGLITPKTVISDVPVYFSGYEPENYDGKYHGLVSVEYALSNSLNVPAVKILNELNPKFVIKSLISAGFQQVKTDRKNLGLSVALGGCGVTLEEMTRLYYALSNKGELKELNFLYKDQIAGKQKKAKRPMPVKLISEEAAYMITEILTKVTRPDLPMEWQNSVNLPKVAWKTGTSYGRRDAWSIGYNKNYTIGVWAGNFSGEGVPELSGSETASPLLFNIFNTLDYKSEANWYELPKGLESRIVCTVTGQVPAEFCNDLAIDYYIPGISSAKPCQHLKEVFISPDSSVSYCTSCRPQLGYIRALYPDYAPEVIAYFDEYRINYKKVPPHNGECERIFAGSAPIITSPLENAEYYVDETDSMQIALSCNAANDVEHVYWYINKHFYRQALPAEKLFFNATEGITEISCSDDKGRNSDIHIQIKKIRF